MTKFLTGTVSRFILIGIMILASLMALGIWIPQVEGIADLDKMPGGYFRVLGDLLSGTGTFELFFVYLFNLFVVVFALILTLTFVITALKIVFTKDFSKQKRFFIGHFILLLIMVGLTAFQINQTDIPIYGDFNPNLKRYETSIALTIMVTLILVGYIPTFFILNKIQLKVVEHVEEKELEENKIQNDSKQNKTTTQEIGTKFEDLFKLKELLDAGAIDEKEFKKEKDKILNHN